jgi:hypothetical protein
MDFPPPNIKSDSTKPDYHHPATAPAHSVGSYYKIENANTTNTKTDKQEPDTQNNIEPKEAGTTSPQLGQAHGQYT